MFDKTQKFRELSGVDSCELEKNQERISEFMEEVNEICRDIMELKRELDEGNIMDLDSIIHKRSEKEEEKMRSSLSNKVQLCQNKILKIEMELGALEGEHAQDRNRHLCRRMIISNIYTLMGEVASQAQSRIAKRLENQYLKSQKFKTRESGKPNSDLTGLIKHSRESSEQFYGDLDAGVDDLTPEMERVAQELLNHFTSDLDALRESQHQLHEISSLMSFFSTKIQEQSEICSTILSDANDAVDHLDESKIHLEKLQEAYETKSYRYYLTYFNVLAALVLLVLDYYKR